MTAPGAPVLELRHVEIRYGGTAVVDDASFDVMHGEFVTLLGPSGSGKTSLLRAIAGFVTPSAGELLLHGVSMRNVAPYQRDIGMVFQNYALFPHMTVTENLTFGPRMMRVPAAEIRARAEEALSKVQLTAFAHRYPHELSGGQQQRVAVARALAMRPSLLLLDEPMSNLDARLRAQMRAQLIDLLKGFGVTALAVTHNQEEALAMSDRIIVMSQGAIRQIGTPTEIYRRPADAFVADFIGDANVVQARYAGAAGEFTAFDVGNSRIVGSTPPAHAGEECILLIRPEAIVVRNTRNGDTVDQRINQVHGELASRAYMGAFIEMRITTSTHQFLVKGPISDELDELRVGDQVLMQWDAAAVVAMPNS